MMQWYVKSGDILDETADVLICSGNGFLDLSGGVGAAIRMKHGMAMQEALHQHRAELGNGAIPRGEIAVVPSCGTQFQYVIHAIAVDVFYRATIETTADVLRRSLVEANRLRAETVAVVALATGYGPLSMEDFGAVIDQTNLDSLESLKHATVVVRHPHEAADIASTSKTATTIQS
ncbi:MAG: macro domain-containing protein [Planctomycetota bacterium]